MSELREAIQEAMKAPQEETETPAEVETPAAGEEAPVEEQVAEGEETPAVEGEEKKDEKKPAPGRDEKGKFAAKEKAEADAKAAAAAGKPAPVVGAAQAAGKPAPVAAEVIKPPASFTPAEREEFAKAPPLIQKAIVRREKETAVALQRGAEGTKIADQLHQVMSPYLGLIAQEGSTAFQAIQRTMASAAALRANSPTHVAATMASIVQEFGIRRFGAQFIEALASAIDGPGGAAKGKDGAPAPYQQGQQFQDPRVDQLLAQQNQERLARTQQATQRTAQQIETFKASHEFFDDVQADIADLIASAQRRGAAMTLEQAYDRACQLHPEIAGVLKQREAAAKAAKAPASTQRAKAAASSVRSAPAAGPKPTQPDSLRSDLKAAIAASSER